MKFYIIKIIHKVISSLIIRNNVSLYIKCCTFLFTVFLSSSVYAFSFKDLDLKIQASISEMYDDNLTYVKEDKKEDFITTLGLGADFTYEGKRRSLNLSGNINQQLQTRFKDIKSSSQNLSLNFTNEFTAYDKITFTDTFSHTQSPASFEEEFGRVRHRRDTYDNSLTLNYLKEISEHLAMNASYTYSQTLFPEEDFDNTSQYGLGFNVRYSHSILTDYILSYSFSRNNLGNSVYNTGIGITKHIYISKKSYLTGNLGFSGSSNNDTRLNLNAAFTNEIDEKSVANLRFNMGDQLTSEGGDVFRSWQIDGGFSRWLSSKLNGATSVFYGKGTYSSTGVTNTLMGISAMASYDFLEDLNGSINYSYSTSAVDKIKEYTKNIVQFQLNKTF